MAVRFDADGESYSATNGSLGVGNFTLLCWGRIVVDRNTNSTFLAVDNGTSTQVCALQTDVDGTTGGAWVNAGGFVTTLNMTVGAWYRMALTRSGTTITGYYGAPGTAPTTGTSGTGTTLTGSTFRIGTSVASEWLNGNVAAVKVYSAALTLDELENEWSAYLPARTANLVRWHPLVQTETVDYSGNGNVLSGGTGAITDDTPPITWAPLFTRSVVPTPPPPTATGDPIVVRRVAPYRR